LDPDGESDDEDILKRGDLVDFELQRSRGVIETIMTLHEANEGYKHEKMQKAMRTMSKEERERLMEDEALQNQPESVLQALRAEIDKVAQEEEEACQRAEEGGPKALEPAQTEELVQDDAPVPAAAPANGSQGGKAEGQTWCTGL